MRFIIHVLATAAALWVATLFVPGIHVGEQNQIVTLVVVALLFGLVNAVIKPIIAGLTCPLYLLTLGLFTFVVNALMLLLTSYLAQNFLGLPFVVDGFWAALIGAIVIGVVSFILSALLGGNKERSR
jgi:putative membrane protein